MTKVEIVDKEDTIQIAMNFKTTEYNKKFSKTYFELSELLKINSKDDTSDSEEKEDNSANNNTNENSSTNTNDSTNTDNNTTDEEKTNDSTNTENTNDNSNTNSNSNTESKTTAKIDDVIYPMYLPDNTYLTSQEIIDTDDGERLIMTFDGDSSFILVEETIQASDENTIIPVSGDFDFLTDVIGVIGTKSLTWQSNGLEYYMASNTIETSELIEIAQSISVLPVSK